MYYRRRASPKHRYNIIEDYGGRGHRTWLRKRSRGSTCVSRGAPAPVYKGARGGGQPAPIGAPGGVLLLVGVGLLLGGGRKWGGRRKGGPPPSPSPIRTRGEEARGPPWLPLSLSTKAHMAHYFSRGGSSNPPALRFSPKSPEHFRCSNIAIQYINLYVSTISRLLVMSVITSGTPN